MRDRFAKDYVVVMLDTDRMTEGKELAAELRKGQGGGIPWMVILDGEGQPLVTSDGPKGNVGCPARPHEVEFFMEHPTWTFTFEPEGGGTRVTAQGEWNVKTPAVGGRYEKMMVKEHEPALESMLASLKGDLEGAAV